jgi:hypothetical protein
LIEACYRDLLRSGLPITAAGLIKKLATFGPNTTLRGTRRGARIPESDQLPAEYAIFQARRSSLSAGLPPSHGRPLQATTRRRPADAAFPSRTGDVAVAKCNRTR